MDSDSSQSEDFQLDVSESPSSSPEWSPLNPTGSESDVSASIASDGDSLLCPILSEAEEESRPEEDVVLHAAGHMSSGKRKSVVAFDSSDSSGDEEVAAAPTGRKASGVRGQKKKRHCIKYQLDWEEKTLLKGWLSKSSIAGKAYCKVCCKDLEFGNGGAYDLERHSKSVVHQRRAQSAKTQPSLRSSVSQASVMSQSVTDGELRMAFFLAEHRLPLAASEHLNQLFSKVCPDSAIAQRLRCARTKTSAAIDVIAGSFHQHLVERMKTQPFSVVVDESCDVAVVEQVAFAVRLAGKTFYVHRNSLYSYP